MNKDQIASVAAHAGRLTIDLAPALSLGPLEWRRLTFHLKRAVRTFTREGGRANFALSIDRAELAVLPAGPAGPTGPTNV